MVNLPIRGNFKHSLVAELWNCLPQVQPKGAFCGGSGMFFLLVGY